MKSYIYILTTSILLIISCKKENKTVIVQSDLIGKWYNIQSQCDTLVFTDKGKALFNSNLYMYNLDDSEISFTYAGLLDIYIPKSAHNILIDM